MKTKYFLIITTILFIGMCAGCKEEGRIEVNSSDKTPPGMPVLRGPAKPLFGGARIYYTVPDDKDLLSVNAEFVAPNGKTFKYSASYFVDSLDVYGLGDTVQYTIKLYAVDRAGNQSPSIDITVKPLESSISRVSKSLIVRPGFSSFYVDWENELQQTVNIYVDFEFNKDGVKRDMISVFSSNRPAERKFINDLTLGPNDPVKVKIRVEDIYGNMTGAVDFGDLYLLQDSQISKEHWDLPKPNDSIAGVPMCFGSGFDGRLYRVIDGEIDMAQSSNYMHTGSQGRTGIPSDGNLPWNVIIDLGDYYELSRIVTHQRHSGGANSLERGQYYKAENVGLYNMYILDEDTGAWDTLTTVKIPIPVDLSDLEIVKLGDAGDMAYMYPDNPRFTKPTRWFRYEALKCFDSNYTSNNANCLSEITLFGRKAN